MDILVLADSHKNLENIKKIINEVEFDIVLYLGDYVEDILRFKNDLKDKLFIVKGNCDGDINFDDDLLLEVAGKKIFMTHGHNYGVKMGMGKLFDKATEVGADVLLFGHTHIPFQSQLDNGIVVLNPGSVGKGALKYNTFGMVVIDDEGVVTTKVYQVL